MTARPSIERLADCAPVPSADSWCERRPPSVAFDRICAALEAQARKTARAIIKDRARAYALRPRELDAIVEGLSCLLPHRLVQRLIDTRCFRPQRWFGFGGETQAINLRGAMLYARYSRAKAHQIKQRGTQ